MIRSSHCLIYFSNLPVRHHGKLQKSVKYGPDPDPGPAPSPELGPGASPDSEPGERVMQSKFCWQYFPLIRHLLGQASTKMQGPQLIEPPQLSE